MTERAARRQQSGEVECRIREAEGDARRLLAQAIEDGVGNLRRMASGLPPTWRVKYGNEAAEAAREVAWALRDPRDADTPYGSLTAGLIALDIEPGPVMRRLRPVIEQVVERYRDAAPPAQRAAKPKGHTAGWTRRQHAALPTAEDVVWIAAVRLRCRAAGVCHRDIAAAAMLSQPTVQIVLAGKSTSPDARAAVLIAAERLLYAASKPYQPYTYQEEAADVA